MKTRLARTIGPAAALDFYRQSLARIVARIGAGCAWLTQVAVTPDDALTDPFLLSLGAELIPQGHGDLGERMQRVLNEAAPTRPAIVVGSDIPELDASHIESAFAALSSHDLAIGPAPDGGYWLIGASRPPPANLFDRVRWSSPDTLTDTLANATQVSVARLAILADVDDESAWRRYVASHDLR